MVKRTSQRGELVAALQQSVRRFTDEVDLYQAAVADRLGMHATDLQYLGFVERYGPTTAGHLAELGGLTTGAVTGVLDRLEKAGYVRRESDPADRRKVVVRVVPGAAERVEALYRPMLASTDPLWDRYSDDELAVVLDFADRAQPLVYEGTAWLRGDGGKDRGAPAPGVEPAELRAPISGLAEATLRLTRGVGHLRIRGEVGLPDLFRGSFPSNPPTARVDRGVVSIQYRRSPFGWRARPGDLALTDAVRWRVEINGGVVPDGGRAARARRPQRHRQRRGEPRVAGAPTAAGDRPGPRGRGRQRPVRRPPERARLPACASAAAPATSTSTAGGSAAMGRDARWSSTDGDDPDQYEIEISGGARTLSVTTA